MTLWAHKVQVTNDKSIQQQTSCSAAFWCWGPVTRTTELARTGMRAAAIKLALINQTSPAVIAINNELWPELRNTINWKHSSIHSQFQEEPNTIGPLTATSASRRHGAGWACARVCVHCRRVHVPVCAFAGLWGSCAFWMCVLRAGACRHSWTGCDGQMCFEILSSHVYS